MPRDEEINHSIRTIYWKDDAVVMIDQRALPLAETTLTCTDHRQVIAAINDLAVRGAPAIGVAAALGIALGALRIEAPTAVAFRDAFEEICRQFAATRPTARNLFWAIERMKRCFAEVSQAQLPKPKGRTSGISFVEIMSQTVAVRPPEKTAGDLWRTIREALVAEAIRVGEEDIAINRRMGSHGCALIKDGDRILTHCNAGALATAGYGTALGVIRTAWEEGKKIHVTIDETRPVLQGARLTAWELTREGIPCTLITDNMAGFLMRQGKVDLVIVGADRIAANGDAANKIGTYALAVLARAHDIPFIIAAPLSTIDPALPDEDAIPIEERVPAEVTHFGGVRIAPEGIAVYNPAFDVTPHGLITAIVTEAGILRPPFAEAIEKACASSSPA
jgi:methylthioribose-1-phosphate isomerase